MPGEFSNPLQFGHDKLAKLGFADPHNAASVLQHYLPAEISEAISWETLTHEPTTFVSDQLEGSAADLLYAAKLRDAGEIKIYVLFEHQSAADRWMPLRLLTYILRIWERLQREDPTRRTLPAIVPVVLHQGPREWRVTRHLSGLIDGWEKLGEQFRERIPHLHYSLIDLSQMDATEFSGTVAARVVMDMLKGAAEGKLLESLQRCLPLLVRLLEEETHAGLVSALWIYILNVDGSSGVRDIQGILERATHPELRSNYMSTLEKLLTEREAKGREEGKIEGQIQLYEELLGLTPTPHESLSGKSLEALAQQLNELKARFQRDAK